MILDIINELNLENGSNYKKSVLKKYKDNDVLKRVLKLTYDKVSYTFGISMKNISEYSEKSGEKLYLESALNILENEFCNRLVTGNAAIKRLHYILESLRTKDAKIFEMIINRDLRINLGRTHINNVFKNLIVKPSYQRCDTYNDKNKSKINYPAIIQVKSDGKFCSVIVDDNVTFISRSGEEFKLPHLETLFKKLPSSVYNGELLVHGITNRAEGNGLLNSDKDKSKVYINLWDMIPLSEYSRPKDKNDKTPYEDRFLKLKETIKSINDINTNDSIMITESYEVNSPNEAMKYVSDWMKSGLEGGILKDKSVIFRDETSKLMLKMKLEISVEMRVTGFIEGKKGTKREKTFGSLVFQNDEETIKGSTSGFTDKELLEINNNREEWIGKIIEVQFNDLTKATNNDYYSLSHPRFIERRDDKNETDTLEKAFKLREMAMILS